MRRLALLAVLLLSASSLFAGTGRLIIINTDNAGTGFNDPTPATPVGGNPGTTLGDQRLAVFERAARRWSDVLDTNVDIRVRASFANLACDDEGAVLGQALPTTWSSNFANAPRQNIWYPAALANKFAGTDLTPSQDDITIQFNSALDLQSCLGDASWYYGFDGNESDNDALLPVVMHEIAHGLGMSARGTPDFFSGRPTVFDTHTLDVNAGLRWDRMSSPQRAVSMLNTGNLVWDGDNVRAKVPQFLEAVTTLTVTQPAVIARNSDIGNASFGPSPSSRVVAGNVVQATDAADTEGPSTTDGCTAFSNAAAIAGKIAMIDRGTCTFVTKARNAQAAGATAMVLVDNRRDTCLPPSMGGSEDTITIPVISISQDDGNAIKAQLAANVSATLHIDPSRRAGTSSQGYARLYAPCTFNPGSSIYHWDTLASPNLLMEPFINADLLDSLDITPYLMLDLGWTMPARTGRTIHRR
jgi:hypothetical protein